MHAFPHRYTVSALAAPGSVVTLRGAELEDIQSTPPPEFGGPPGNWSPETLFVAAVADCFVLSFRAVANASKLEWSEIDCDASGILEKTPEGLWFTAIELRARLRIPAGGDVARAGRLLEKAEQTCLISRSLKSAMHLDAQVSAG
jgi:organic hydroperoxide reductase OsmC/OhrA